MKEWVEQYRERKWNWAKKLANMSEDRWAKVLLMWEPTDGSRRWGHPDLRWDDGIASIFAEDSDSNRRDWLIFALDDETWTRHSETYCCK